MNLRSRTSKLRVEWSHEASLLCDELMGVAARAPRDPINQGREPHDRNSTGRHKLLMDISNGFDNFVSNPLKLLS